MVTARLALQTLVAGASTRADLISYWNSNADILDALISTSGLKAGERFIIRDAYPNHDYIGYDTNNDCQVHVFHRYATGIRWQTFDTVTVDVMKLSPLGELWLSAGCSAESFTDRTPHFSGDALSAIAKIRASKDGGIDHATLPEFAIMPYQDEKGEWWPGRSLGDMLSILVKATQERSAQVAAAIAERDAKIAELSARIDALAAKFPA